VIALIIFVITLFCKSTKHLTHNVH